jgi:hypothetical protein
MGKIVWMRENSGLALWQVLVIKDTIFSGNLSGLTVVSQCLIFLSPKRNIKSGI